MIRNDGSIQVTIKKDELLEAVKTNREKHSQEYLEAVAGYRIAVKAKAKMLIESIDDGGPVDMIPLTKLSPPVSYLKDYDRVIRMYTMSVATEITISEDQFSKYVLDEWEWSHTFKNVTSAYNGRR